VESRKTSRSGMSTPRPLPHIGFRRSKTMRSSECSFGPLQNGATTTTRTREA
jgi:hypothetical protein